MGCLPPLGDEPVLQRAMRKADSDQFEHGGKASFDDIHGESSVTLLASQGFFCEGLSKKIAKRKGKVCTPVIKLSNLFRT
jgi:hypothetical protein